MGFIYKHVANHIVRLNKESWHRNRERLKETGAQETRCIKGEDYSWACFSLFLFPLTKITFFYLEHKPLSGLTATLLSSLNDIFTCSFILFWFICNLVTFPFTGNCTFRRQALLFAVDTKSAKQYLVAFWKSIANFNIHKHAPQKVDATFKTISKFGNMQDVSWHLWRLCLGFQFDGVFSITLYIRPHIRNKGKHQRVLISGQSRPLPFRDILETE